MGRRRGGRAPNLHWSGFQNAFNAMSAGSVSALGFAAIHGTETLLRIRGSFSCWIDGVQAPGGSIVVSVGMILVPEGTGATLLWSPGAAADADAPWIWYSTFVLAYEEYVTDTNYATGMTYYREVIDSKAMRVIRNQEVQVAVTNVTGLGAMSLNLSIQGRALTQE